MSWALFGAEAISALYDLRWMLVLMVALICGDFWFGLKETRMHREKAKTKRQRDEYKFRFSRAGRRTLNKAVDYLTYMLLGCIIGYAVTEPLGIATHIATASIGAGFACIFELSSILGHVFALKNLKVHFDLRKFIFKIVKIKNEDIGEALDESIEIIKDK